MVLSLGKRFFAVICALWLIIGALLLANCIWSQAKVTESNSASQENDMFSIIMYHQVTENKRLLGRDAVTAQELEGDLKFIKENGYNTITMGQLIDYALGDGKLPPKPIMLTFDDGYESFSKTVVPLLEKYDMCAVVAVIGSAAEKFTKTEDHHMDYSHMSWKDIAALADNPHVEIQNHTYDMHKMENGRNGCKRKRGESSAAYEAALTEDLMKLQAAIKEHTGKEPNTMVFPYGAFTNETVEIAKKLGFKAVLTCRQLPNKLQKGDNWLYSLGRINRPSGKTSEEFFAYALG